MNTQDFIVSESPVLLPRHPLIFASTAISIISCLAILIFFIISVSLEKPAFRDYGTLVLVVMLIDFLLLLCCGVLGLVLDLSTKEKRTYMVGISIFSAIVIVAPSVIALVHFHNWVLSNCSLAFAIAAGIIVLVLDGLFYLCYPEKEQSTHSLTVELNLREERRILESNIKTTGISTEANIKEVIAPVPCNNITEFNAVKERVEEKEEEDKGSDENLMSEEEAEMASSIVKELPPMHNPEIMEHMSAVGKGKVIWKKTHFIIALESGSIFTVLP
eukprot:TRINITY_DN8054_c0_g1_i1.p1 TRINITY_DN8054_c0_g1~~TRINITY_DN8054_c0_g1_i1.p1  ORF type:complete len:274 (+),score=36.87 TRINITY_DN8054_c0_g1_i1:208-1029(+)